MLALLFGLAGCGAGDAAREVRLVGWLDLSERPGARALGSRSQAVFLHSMAIQHPAIDVVIYDVSGMSADSRWNRVNDWGLRGLTVSPSPDPDASAPSVVLRDADGALVRRWEGFIGPAQLDLTLRSLGSAPSR